MENVEREIRITEEEFSLISQGLQMLRKRSLQAAEQTRKGYNTVKSQNKYVVLKDKAEQCNEIESKLANIFS
jgi:hypothetical protein